MSRIEDKVFGISSAAIEVLEKLFLFGPTLDGDLPSKNGRGELCRLSYCDTWNGWSFLTSVGIEYAVSVLLLEGKKARFLRERSEAIHLMRHPKD